MSSLFVVMYSGGVLIYLGLILIFAEHSEEGRDDGLVTDAHQMREALAEGCRGLFQTVVWNLEWRKMR